jgi:transcription elongation factor Elf1
MTEQRKPKRESKPKNVVHLVGTLRCSHCASAWSVVDLNPERKAVPCPVCGTLNDIREAMKAAA